MAFSDQKKHLPVNGSPMAYIDAGTGAPIVFLHGNPTSSFLWRNILKPLESVGRCIAPDLIGMGDSAKLAGSGPGTYSFDLHGQHLDGLLEQLGVDDEVTLVLHDWGSALGFDWARRNPDKVRGIAYMEGIVMPMSWEQWPAPTRPVFEGMRSSAGEGMILEKNIFVERILPASIMRRLTDCEMDEYRRPFVNPGEDRRPMLDWPRQMPLGGEPADLCPRIAEYAAWMAENEIPKLFINADPGAILIGEQREFCRSWKNQTEVTVPGIHFIQEDSPELIATAIGTWLTSI